MLVEVRPRLEFNIRIVSSCFNLVFMLRTGATCSEANAVLHAANRHMRLNRCWKCSRSCLERNYSFLRDVKSFLWFSLLQTGGKPLDCCIYRDVLSLLLDTWTRKLQFWMFLWQTDTMKLSQTFSPDTHPEAQCFRHLDGSKSCKLVAAVSMFLCTSNSLWAIKVIKVQFVFKSVKGRFVLL